MSKFLDRLERITRGASRSLGFSPAARAEQIPPMALVGLLSNSAKTSEGAAALANIGVDGVLIGSAGVDDVGSQVVEALGSVPWGIRTAQLGSEKSSGYKELGSDFLAFGPEGSQLEALGDEDTAYILCIEREMDERSLRAIEALPVDVVLLRLDPIAHPLTIKHLIEVGAVRRMFSQYLLLEIPGVPSTKELEGLRDMGIDGLVVDAAKLSTEEIEGLKGRILALPRRQRNRQDRHAAVLPGTSAPLPGRPSREDDDDDDDDDE
jgi:hypothetical protein